MADLRNERSRSICVCLSSRLQSRLHSPHSTPSNLRQDTVRAHHNPISLMAFGVLRILRFPQSFTATRYYYTLCYTCALRFHHFHTLNHPDTATTVPLPLPSHDAPVTERFVLEQLFDLLPTEKTRDDRKSTGGICVADGLLSPAEKLRGIFLQKNNGISAVESALFATGVEITSEIFAEVVNWGSLGGKAMVSFFDWAIKQRDVPRSTETYNVILKALGRRRFFSFMEEVLFRMKKDGVTPDVNTVAVVFDSYVAGRQVYKAVETFDRLEEIGVATGSESLAAILHSLCRWGHLKIARSVFNKMRGKIAMSTEVYNEIIGGWAKLGRVEEVEGIWDAMVADGLKPDTCTFGHLIKSLGKTGRITDAVVAFEKMEEGCAPDTITLNAMISNFIFAKDLDKALEYYHDWVSKNCLPDADTHAKLISALLKFRRVSDALELYDMMLTRGTYPTTRMITSFLEHLCSYGPPHAAMLIYNKAKKVGCKVSMKAYKLLLRRLSIFGKCGMVLKLWEEMQEDGHSSDLEVYEYIIHGLCNTGKLDHAVLVMEESMKNGFCIGRLVYSKLSNKLLEMNRVETAYKLLLKVREARLKTNMQRIWRYNGWHY